MFAVVVVVAVVVGAVVVVVVVDVVVTSIVVVIGTVVDGKGVVVVILSTLVFLVFDLKPILAVVCLRYGENDLVGLAFFAVISASVFVISNEPSKDP